MEPGYLQYLFDRYESDSITESEQSELFTYLDDTGNREEVLSFLEECLLSTAPEILDRQKWDKVIAGIQGKGKVRSIPLWKKLAAVAAVLVLIALSSYFLLFNNKGSTPLAITTEKPLTRDIAPGTNGAVLTLASGQKIILDSLQNGIIATQGSSHIIKTNGQVTYNKQHTTGGTVYNTMETPRGRQYQLLLEDGTKVWLNAASSITYPIAFTGNKREVKITGEAYFEVAHDNTRPFHVSVNGMDVEVLGTHFNVNGYADEETMKTTLLEGKVKISKGGSIALLQPGQQAIVSGERKLQVIEKADTEEAIAWKSGRFVFKSADIKTMMRQISRWYDVDISYPDGVPPGSISGEIPRNVPASQAMSMLQFVGIHFKIEDKKIIVMP